MKRENVFLVALEPHEQKSSTILNTPFKYYSNKLAERKSTQMFPPVGYCTLVQNLFILPVQGPWPFLGWGCGGLEWRGPLLCLRSLGALSLVLELGLNRSRGGSEEGCPSES